MFGLCFTKQQVTGAPEIPNFWIWVPECNPSKRQFCFIVILLYSYLTFRVRSPSVSLTPTYKLISDTDTMENKEKGWWELSGNKIYLSYKMSLLETTIYSFLHYQFGYVKFNLSLTCGDSTRLQAARSTSSLSFSQHELQRAVFLQSSLTGLHYLHSLSEMGEWKAFST